MTSSVPIPGRIETNLVPIRLGFRVVRFTVYLGMNIFLNRMKETKEVDQLIGVLTRSVESGFRVLGPYDSRQELVRAQPWREVSGCHA